METEQDRVDRGVPDSSRDGSRWHRVLIGGMTGAPIGAALGYWALVETGAGHGSSCLAFFFAALPMLVFQFLPEALHSIWLWTALAAVQMSTFGAALGACRRRA